LSHEITGYRASDTERTNDIAFLSRAAGNPLNSAIYDALDCPEHNCGVSGCGGEQEFTTDELRTALARLPTAPEYDKERDFLRQCIAVGENVTIGFF
jgi:hypothetical protein